MQSYPFSIEMDLSVSVICLFYIFAIYGSVRIMSFLLETTEIRINTNRIALTAFFISHMPSFIMDITHIGHRNLRVYFLKTSSRRRQSPQPPTLIVHSVPYSFFDFHVRIPIFLNFLPFFLFFSLVNFSLILFIIHFGYKNHDFYLWHSFNVYVFSRTSRSLY